MKIIFELEKVDEIDDLLDDVAERIGSFVADKVNWRRRYSIKHRTPSYRDLLEEQKVEEEEEEEEEEEQGPETYEVELIMFGKKEDADAVLKCMREDVLNRYHECSVYDYYDLAGEALSNPEDRKWGWRDLSMAKVEKEEDTGGYYIYLPEVVRLD